MVHYDFLKAFFLTGKSEPVTKGEEGEIAYLFEVRGRANRLATFRT